MSNRTRTEFYTTQQVADLLGVGVTTVKRWADAGQLPSMETAGHHRRFLVEAVERMRANQRLESRAGIDASLLHPWMVIAVTGSGYKLEAVLLEARDRLGSWAAVADAVGVALNTLGEAWANGTISIADEHLASTNISRTVGRLSHVQPTGANAPLCLLACPEHEEHGLGLALAELATREAGWQVIPLGTRTPAVEVARKARELQVSVLALSASRASSDSAALARLEEESSIACDEIGALLVLGGEGAWPTSPRSGKRVQCFREYQRLLATRRNI
ncbi:MAG: helix-turn-helix domain-containing protein [Planctomycetota bacterium]